MNKKINNLGFTIVELVVWIAITVIIIMWSLSINFKSISDRQNLEIFTNKIIWEIEKVRNYALIWKWIGTNILVPRMWKIEFNKWWNWTWSWTLITSYSMDWSTWTQENKINVDKNISIQNVHCISVWWADVNLTNTQTWIIFFEWWKYNLWWDCLSSYSTLKIDTFSRWYNRTLEFDVINWLIKK